ncbi:NAD(P)-binding protein [Myriangium duriaei CBS 260.36]|uniref:NAD(P)-binding protein n=1 Tax=Myriangium duriaei CBS 260.36 TaxID=1168546 RepID=A0A9P4ISH5_9PEZI|nr:NAD(P)-binding protein [Myriangium duriaei CBS 260.36]
MTIFLTGATGYLGGDTLHQLIESGIPASQISCLVRSEEKAKPVEAAYPGIRIVIGDLDNSALLETESEAANIVLNLASTSHAGGFSAIAKGLTRKAKPGYWIQIGGASVVSARDVEEKRWGEPPEASYDDAKDSDAIVSLIKANKKRVAENILLSQPSDALNYALILGPLIYGDGRGPVHQRSMQAPDIAKVTLQRKKGFTLGRGLNIWSNIHVRDISSQVGKLVQAAQKSHRDDLWNAKGIYAVENGQMEFGELSRRIAKSAHEQGFIDSPSSDDKITGDQADSLVGHASVLWGTNAVLKSTKSQSLLGWKAQQPSLAELVPAIVKEEAAALEGK